MRLIPFIFIFLPFLAKAQFTTDLCNGGTASASSSFSATYNATKAFDDVYNATPVANCWASNGVPSAGSPQWIQYDFGAGNEKTITKYVITARNLDNNVLNTPRDWTFLASNTGAFAGEEVVLDTRTTVNDWNIVLFGVNAVFPTTHEYEIVNATPYRYYRVKITANNGGSSYVAIGEMEMMEDEAAPSLGNEGSVWYFGYNAAIDFRYNPPRTLTNSNMTQWEGCASVCDANGNLLFYTNGVKVWNRNNEIMPNGTGLLGDAASTQSSIIVPQPGNDSIYYIFTAAKNGEVNGFRYTAVNVNADNGLGDVVIAKKNILINTPHSEKMTAIRHSNGTDIWVLTHNYGLDFQAYLVSSTGVNLTPIISTVGSTHAGGVNNWNAAGYMKASPKGKKVAVNILASAKTEVFDFDNATGIISNPITLTSSRTRCYGLEFSPDGSKLYTTSWMGNDIVQYDLSLGSAAAIIASENVCAVSDVPADGSSNFKGLGALQIGPDERIYVSRDNVGSNGYFDAFNQSLGVIENPNVYGAACNYNDYGIYLNGRASGLGLPNFIQSLFVVDVFSNNFCQGDSTSFLVSNSNNIDSLNWNFDDPTTGANNTSTLFEPSHVFSSAGSYNVQLVYFRNGTSDTIWHNVTILNATTINLGIDTSLCSGDSILLDAGINLSNYSWSTGDNAQSIYALSTGNYYVSAIDTNGCSTSDTISISVQSPLDATITPISALLCNNNSPITLTAQSPGGSWSGNGITDMVNGVFDPTVAGIGNHWVYYEITGSCGDKDSLEISILGAPSIAFAALEETCTDKGDGSITAVVSNGVTPYSYSWNNGSTDTTIENLTGGSYSLTVTGANNCSNTLSYNLASSPLECLYNYHVYIPNVFSPNGDGNNDNLIFQGEGILNFHIAIFDRWGEKIFESSDVNDSWDGKYQGELLNTGVFVYQLNVTYLNDETEERSGTITLLR